MDKTPTKADIKDFKTVFLVGIGGAGVSALAAMLLAKGKKVAGSDLKDSPVLGELRAMGATVSIGQDVSLVPEDVDAVVYSVALTELDPEFFAKLQASGKPLFTYPQFLGLAAKEYDMVAIAGTHGKTTTTAMVAKVMMDAGLDPTVVVGSALGNGVGNFIQGKGKWLVVEADEYRRAFANYAPKILAITNVGLDHLNYFTGIDDIEAAFTDLARSVPEDGRVIIDARDGRLVRIARAGKAHVDDWAAFPEDFTLAVPGKHNRENAKVALAVAAALGISMEAAKASLRDFKNPARRFEYKGKTSGGAPVYDDYAHNPDKVRAAIAGAREAFPDKRIVVLFQPHTYSRTKSLFAEFAKSFKDADEVLVFPIFAAREAADPTITPAMVADSIRASGVPASVAADFDSVLKELSNKDPSSVLMTVGAGDITKLATMLATSK